MKRDGQKKEKKVQAWPWVLQSLRPVLAFIHNKIQAFYTNYWNYFNIFKLP